jgi:broad specificity phosphatase PhoE
MGQYRDWGQILLYISDWIEHGETAKQIAEHLHMEVRAVTRQLRRMKAKGIPVPELKAEKPHRPVGVKRKPFTGRQKSEEQWAEIRNNVITWLQENVSREDSILLRIYAGDRVDSIVGIYEHSEIR